MLKFVKKVMGIVLLIWGAVRVIPDALESAQATEKYAKWFYAHLAAPHSAFLTLGIVVIGLGLIFSETIQHHITAFWKSAEITGIADLMLQELDLGDLRIINGGAAYAINLAAFARMEIAVLDKPRTVTHFEMEMTGPSQIEYRAKSEYDLGEYDYVHDETRHDSWGLRNLVDRVREPMQDLMPLVRNPIQPGTHVGRAWVRFEIPDVRGGDEPRNCTIRIYAVDPSGKKHEITTDQMNVKAIDSHEFAAPRRQ